MDQPSICLFLDKQWLPASTIHESLVAVLGPGAITSSIAIKYLRGLLWTLDKKARPISRSPNVVDQATRIALDEQPFSSVLDDILGFSNIETIHEDLCERAVEEATDTGTVVRMKNSTASSQHS
jgi:hypothetical protein